MTKRYVSLDVLRGLTVALMIIVNNPGSWSNIFPPLRHAAWDGCTPCDLVFPFFLFCVGASMAFALAKYDGLSGKAFWKISRRGLLLYLVGLLLTAFPFYPAQMNPEMSFWQNWLQWAQHLRLVGVLPRIAMCYVLASVLVLWLRTIRKIWGAIATLSVLHVGILLAFAGPEGAFSLHGNAARAVDLAVFGENHIYKGFGIPFDPEGLLGVLTGSCTVMLGYLVGKMIRKTSASADPAAAQLELPSKMFALSVAAIIFGLALSLVIPLNKALWSVSYVFYTSGWAMFVLALLIYLIDVKGWEKPFIPFKAFGMNALALFVLSGLLMKINWRYIEWDYTAIFGGSEAMSLLFAVLFMLLHMAIAMLMYRKKIFIKL